MLHITSLPGELGNGDLGEEAHRFIEFLAATGVSVWQTLPLGQAHGDGSPYQCLSVHAGNPNLIDLDWLARKGWLVMPPLPDSREPAVEYRQSCLREAYSGFRERADEWTCNDYQGFVHVHRKWLDDYALFTVLREEFHGRAWYEWPGPYRNREIAALAEARRRLRHEIGRVKFEQYLFFRQWHELKVHAHQKGVLLFGDVPIFVAHDSADVWVHREYFDLDAAGAMRVTAGVPPDYFSETGQHWGSPHYRWERMETDGFHWWIERLRSQLDLFDWVRIDHFRGLEAFWEIPAEEKTARNGRWVKAPGEALLARIREVFGSIPLVAEDLGVITPEVEALRDRFGLPGMKILQFAFDNDSNNPYLPHNHLPNSVVYTGTHDNDTTLSWFESLERSKQEPILEYLGYPRLKMPWALVQCALASVCRLAVFPMQDVLELGAGCRMNTPGTTLGNWRWRFSWDQLTEERVLTLKRLVKLYGRGG